MPWLIGAAGSIERSCDGEAFRSWGRMIFWIEATMAPLRGTASSSEGEEESSVEKDLPKGKSTGGGRCEGHLQLPKRGSLLCNAAYHPLPFCAAILAR